MGVCASLSDLKFVVMCDCLTCAANEETSSPLKNFSTRITGVGNNPMTWVTKPDSQRPVHELAHGARTTERADDAMSLALPREGDWSMTVRRFL
jgi:hypothetical protein